MKPQINDYVHDPEHRPIKYTGTTSNSRTVISIRRKKVRSKLNNVSPHMQGICAFMFMHLLQSISKGGDGGDGGEGSDGGDGGEGSDGGEGGEGGEGGGKHQHPMKSFLRELVEHCAYGKLHTAKKYRRYAILMCMGEEYCPDWFNEYNSDYIILTTEARYESFQALLDLLSEPSSIYVLSETDMKKIIDGIVCMLALPDSVFQGCFDRTSTLPPDHHLYREPSESTTQTPGSFYIELLHALEKAVKTLWSGKSHEESLITFNSGPRGMGRDSYFNIIDIYFTDYYANVQCTAFVNVNSIMPSRV